MHLVGDIVLQFEITGELGRGGWGIVYAARHVLLGTAHAIKVVRAEQPAMRLRALREARIQARLTHPQVLRATDVFEADARVYIVFDLVQGPTLARRLASGPLSGAEAQAVALALAQGVAFLHRRRIIHRDIKPSNILLEPVLATPVCRLGDFGIARDLDEPDGVLVTDPSAVFGTPRYMAPERLRGRAATAPSVDIYSLGCVLYELYTGARPFPDGDLQRQIALREAERYPLPSVRQPGLDPWLDRVIEACLRGDPARRLPSADVLVGVLLGEVDPGPWARGSLARSYLSDFPNGEVFDPLTTQPLSPRPTPGTTPR